MPGGQKKKTFSFFFWKCCKFLWLIDGANLNATKLQIETDMTERNQYVKISNLNNLKPPIRVNLDECNSRRKCGLQSAASDITQTLVLVICLFVMIIEPFLGNAGQFLCIYYFARIQQQFLKLGFRISAQSEKHFCNS